MAYYGNYQEVQLLSTASVIQETRLLQRPLDLGQNVLSTATWAFPNKPNWYSPDGTLPFSFSYDHPWHLSVSGATQAYTTVSRACPLSGVIDFGAAGIMAGSVSFTGYFYRVTAPSSQGLPIISCTEMTRAYHRETVGSTPYGASHRRRLPSFGRQELTLSLLLDASSGLAALQTAKDSGRVHILYIYGSRGIGMQKRNPLYDFYFDNVTFGTFLLAGRVTSLEVTGSVDGLLEAVVSFAGFPVGDAVLDTRIYSEIDVGNLGEPYETNVL